jgi:hypothetical protein
VRHKREEAEMAARTWATVRGLLLALVGLAVVAAGANGEDGGGGGAAPRLRVALSNSGMEGLEGIQLQVHVAGAADWRELVGADEESIKAKMRASLRNLAGLTIVEGHGNRDVPRLLVIAVGHVIADPDGEKDTAATSLSVSLNQPVAVRRPGRQIMTSGATWQRSLLITGLKESMAQRVSDKLDYLLAQFKGEWEKANSAEKGEAES